MIKIENIEKKYAEHTVLKNVSLQVNKGDIFGLVGTSGAGKSTLLKIINGLETVDSGTVLVNKVNISNLNDSNKRDFQKKIGMIFQNFALLERKNVFDNVAFPLVCAKYSKEYIDEKVNYLLDKVGISDKKAAFPSQLSGGQRQRVAIARALSLEPDILLCDEATSGLDPKMTKNILDLLKSINEKDGITIIVVTHEIDVIEKICDKLIIIEKSKIIMEGLVEDVIFEYYNSNSIDTNQLEKDKLLVKISYCNNEINNKLLADLAIKNNLNFSIETIYAQELKDKTINHYILKINSLDYSKLEDYLINKDVKYSLVKREINYG